MADGVFQHGVVIKDHGTFQPGEIVEQKLDRPMPDGGMILFARVIHSATTHPGTDKIHFLCLNGPMAGDRASQHAARWERSSATNEQIEAAGKFGAIAY